MEMLLDKFIDLIKYPPFWVVAVIIAGISSHILDKVMGFINKHHKGPNGLVVIIELFILFVLGALTLHRFLHLGAEEKDSNGVGLGSPYILLVAFVVFGLI